MADNKPEEENILTEKDGISPPCSKVLKVDGALRHSCNEVNCKQLLLNSIEVNNKLNSPNLDADVHPTPYVLAQLSWKVYTQSADGRSQQLPAGWHLLTTAHRTELRSNGYFGAAYWNPETQQVVIAHRGTKGLMDVKAIHTDLWSIVRRKYTSRMNSAITFTDKIRRILNEVNKTPGASFQLTLTGHSLGGWLAQVTCFSCKYLQQNGVHFIKSNESESIHTHTVVFDSPGCKDMLSDMKKEYDVRYNSSMSLSKLDVTNYVSAPNRVNTCNLHLGTVYRVFIDLSDMNFMDKHSVQYNLATHRIDKIVQVFDANTGDVICDTDGKLKVQEVVDWPLTEYPGRMWEEFSDFFQWANCLNDYHPDVKKIFYKDEQNICVRYQTTEYREDYCSLSVFTDNEHSLLECWHTLIHSNSDLKILQQFTNKHNLGDCNELLPDYHIRRDKIVISSKEPAKNMINRTKQLVRFFGAEFTEAVKKQLDMPTLAEAMCKATSDLYLDSLVKYEANFRDVINLKEFLDSENELGKRVLHVISEDEELEVSRIRNICKQMELQFATNLKFQNYILSRHQLYLTLEQIQSLQNFVDVVKILESKSCTINLLVIVYSAHSIKNKQHGALLENIFSCIKETSPLKKIIFITSKQQSVNENIKSVFSDVSDTLTNEVANISFEHLTLESQNTLLSKPILEMQRDKVSLKDVFGIHNIDKNTALKEKINTILDSHTIKNFLVNGHFVETEYKIMGPIDQVSYVQISKESSVESALQFLLNDECVGNEKNVLFMITGIYGCIRNAPDELIIRLHVNNTDEIKKIQSFIGKRIFINTDPHNNIYHFKQYCSNNSDKRIYWLEVKEKNVTWKEVFDSDFYIQRELYSQNILNNIFFEEIFMSEFVPDLFIFANNSRESLIGPLELSKKRKKLLLECENFLTFSDEKEAFSKFEEISKTHKPTHLIYTDSDNKHVWRRSCGSLDNIRPYIGPADPTIEETFLQIFLGKKEKFIIFSGDAGMGKSTTLYSLSQQLKSSWVIHVDLKNYLAHPETDLSSDVDIDKIIHFLSMGNSFLSTNLTSALLKECLIRVNSMPVFILFDGFDEVNTELLQHSDMDDRRNRITQEKIIEIIDFLKEKTTANIWVTCRKLLSTKLENRFSVFGSTFKEMEKKRQSEFLMTFWWSRLALQRRCGDIKEQQKQLQEYINESFDIARKSLGKEITTFIEVPLQLRMIAEVGQPQFKLFSESEIQYYKYPLRVNNVFELYQRFIDVKYNIYFHEKSGLSTGLTHANRTWIAEMLNKRHKSLAFSIFFPGQAKEFLGEKHISLIGDMRDNEKVELLRVGLIHLKADGNIDFVHRTFAEFFLADLIGGWLNKVHGRNSKFPTLEDFLVSKIILNPQCKVVRLFLNNHLSYSGLCEDSFRFHVHRFAKLWMDRRELFLTKDHQTVLHILTYECCEKLIELFLGQERAHFRKDNCIVDISDLVGVRNRNEETAVYIAAKFQYKHLVEKYLNFIKFQTVSVREKILLETLFRKSKDKDDKNIEYILKCMSTAEYSCIHFQTKIITEKWQYIYSFLGSARTDDVSKIHEYFNKLGKINGQNRVQYLSVTDKTGKTALHLAAGLGHFNVVEYLVNQKADMNAREASGKTPLILAASSDFPVIVQYLVEQGADFSITDRNGTNAVSWAAKYGNLEIVQYLADSGANIHATDDSGRTVIAWAAKSCKLGVVKYLAELGANINIVDKQGRSVLQIAVKARSWGIAKYLLEFGAHFNNYDWNGMNALQLAIKNAKWSFVNLLIEREATLDSSHWKGSTLCQLVKNGKWNIIQTLHERGADVNCMPIQEKQSFIAYMVSNESKGEAQSFRKNHASHINTFYFVLQFGKNEFQQLLINSTDIDVRKKILPQVKKYIKTRGETISNEMEISIKNMLEESNMHVTI